MKLLGQVKPKKISLRPFNSLAQTTLPDKKFTELWLEGSSGDHPVQPPAKAGLSKAGDTGMQPGRFLMSPERQNSARPFSLLQVLWHLHCEVLPQI